MAGAPDLGRLMAGCYTRTYDAATRTLTLNFGLTSCLCPDGRYRRGVTTAVFSGPYRLAGVVVTIDRTNYFANDNQHLERFPRWYTWGGLPAFRRLSARRAAS